MRRDALGGQSLCNTELCNHAAAAGRVPLTRYIFLKRGDVGKGYFRNDTRILRYIKPDFVHVLVKGRVAEEGGPELAERLEDEGYDRYLEPSDIVEE